MSRLSQLASLARKLSRLVPSPQQAPARGSSTPAPAGSGSGRLTISYAPTPDGQADPGEVVWAWVPYEEDASQGKDRPVLVIGTVGDQLATLMLTSKDHDRDAEQEASWGRHWMDVGTGDWDSQHRPSEVRLDRLIALDPSSVRREGAALDRAVFDQVVAAARPYL